MSYISSVVGEIGCPYRHQDAGFWSIRSQNFGLDVWDVEKMLEKVRKNVGADLEPIKSQHFAGDAFSDALSVQIWQ